MEPVQQKIKAVAYFRMSSDDQKTSISQQRREVRAFASEHGYEIVDEYVDEGKSGSKDQHKRVAFAAMLADACNGNFEAVLCWNTARFARLDSVDAAGAKVTLRKQGIHLATAKEGRIDWDSFEGRILDVLRSESDHKFSRDISAQTVRGRLDALRRGFWPNGAVPYGYDRLYFDGVREHLVKRSEPFRKPRNWQLKLVINEAEAKVVRWIFEEFCGKDRSLRQIALELSQSDVPSPGNRQGGWTKDSVKGILCNRIYIGVGQIGVGRRRAKEAFSRAEPTAKDGCCPEIIERGQFDAAHERLRVKRDSGRKPHNYRSSALSGCLRCGHCGYRLDKKERKGQTYFTCSSATRRPHLGCRQWRIHEHEVLPLICRRLVEELDKEILKTIHARPKSPIHDPAVTLERRRDALRRQIKRGNERYLIAPPELSSDLAETLMMWKRELADIDEDILRVEISNSDGGSAAFVEWLNRMKSRLVTVSEIVWGKQVTERHPILLSENDRKAIQRFLGSQTGKCRARWKGDPDTGYQLVLGAGNLIELDVAGAWEWIEFEYPVQPAILADPETLRGLLHSLNVNVTVYWKPNGDRYFRVDQRRLQAEVNEHFLAVRTVMLGRRTNTWV